MRWLSSAAAVQLLYLLNIATAIPDYGFGAKRRLEPRREALLLFKRQGDPFCREGYYQCRPEFGGGCCPDNRFCATRDCPALSPGEQDIPGAFTDTRPPQSFTNPPPSSRATRTIQPPQTTGGATTEAPETTTTEAPETTTTEAPETTTEAPTTSAAETDTETTAPTTAPQSTEASSTGTNTESQSGTATNAADAAETTTGNPAADGSLYTPMGISSGAIVGIVFAGITGAVIVGLVLWRAIIGIRHPKKKGRRPPPSVPGVGGAGGAGAAGAGGFFGGNRRIFGAFSNPFGGKKNGPGASEAMIPRSADDEDNAPMSQTAAAMGFGPQPTGSEGAPPYVQDRGSLDDQDTSYNRAAYTGGDLGYRGVDSFDRQDDDTQGLFPRAGGFPNR